jgi:hypothetical protein
MKEEELDWHRIRQNLLQGLDDLKTFFRHPLDGIEKVPSWDFPTALILTGGLGTLAGCTAAILNRSISGFFMSFLIVPISSIVYIGLAAGFFYYVFLFVFKVSVRYRELYIINILAAIPSYICFTVAQRLPPISLLGIALNLFLLRQAFFSSFRISKSALTKLMVILFVFYSVSWVMNSLNLEKGRQNLKKMATPESLDILEKELNN